MKKRMLTLILALIMVFGISVPAFAVSDEWTIATKYLTDNKIYVGDGNGNLNLESGLTRAELAVILTRIRGDEEKVKANLKDYTLNCYFLDVPEWAKPFVGYCADEYLMVGYDLFHFGPSDPVTPQAASTVLLRHMGIPETDWNYNTSCTKAQAIGIAPSNGLDGKTIARGDMGVMIYKVMTGSTSDTGDQTATGKTIADGSGTISNVPLTTKVLDGTDLSREDFSSQANPAVFDSVYTRGAYNAIRQTIVDRDKIVAGNDADGFNPYYSYASVTANAATRSAVNEVIRRLEEYLFLAISAEPYVSEYYKYPDYFTIEPRAIPALADVHIATNDIIARVNTLSTDADKVRALNEYLCDRMDFDATADTGMKTVFTSETKVKGRCSNFASCFLYLCNRANIPCITISGEDHAWNLVYADGKWLYVDVSLNTQGPSRASMLLTETSRKTDEHPKATAYAKELLVPGSTK